MAGSPAWRRLAAVLDRDRLPALARKQRGPLLTLVVVAVLVWWAWPPTGHPIRFPDSKGYFNWPLRSLVDGVEWMGWRPVGYPLVLYVTGTGAALAFRERLRQWLCAIPSSQVDTVDLPSYLLIVRCIVMNVS